MPVPVNGPLASVEDIQYCFRLIPFRNPHPEERQDHSSLAGKDLSLAVAYINSLEFANRDPLRTATNPLSSERIPTGRHARLSGVSVDFKWLIASGYSLAVIALDGNAIPCHHDCEK